MAPIVGGEGAPATPPVVVFTSEPLDEYGSVLPWSGPTASFVKILNK